MTAGAGSVAGVAAARERGSCTRCSCSLARRMAFALGGELRCLRCAIRHRLLLRRSVLTSAVVGSILAAINQGPAVLGGQFRPGQVWQIALNYAVPFCVATWGGLINSRR